MKEKRDFIVLGLGSFGTALANRLAENGCRVTGVDRDEATVSALRDKLFAAVIGDVTSRESLEELMVSEAAAVFISLGESIEPSILAALHVKELGARRIYAKGVTPDHGRILSRLGVSHVIFPEADVAVQLADRATWPNMLEIVTIDPEYSIVELAVPSSLVGETLQEADLRRRYGVLVLAVKDMLAGRLEPIPKADLRLTDDQMLVILGSQRDIKKFRELH